MIILHAINIELEPSESEVKANVRLVIPIKFVLNILIRQVPILPTMSAVKVHINAILFRELPDLIYLNFIIFAVLVVVFEEIAQTETQKLAEALGFTHLPGLFKEVWGRHIDVIESAPVLDLLKCPRVQKTLRHAVVYEVGELNTYNFKPLLLASKLKAKYIMNSCNKIDAFFHLP